MHSRVPLDAGDGFTTIGSSTDDETSVRGLAPTTAFNGTDRFSLRRRLGAGGFGVVYEAYDRARNTVIALKLLQNVTPDTLYRFKREFRSLSDVHHKNLVQLHELFSFEGHWFFTMELVNGRDFVEYVGAAHSTPSQGERRLRGRTFDRLVAALHQLVEGLSTLHHAGHVHRDVKPPNVLVTREGRVVLLDFGLLLDVQDQANLQTLTIAGTPMYMSPEQAAGLPITPASDWYSVGVMLYQALTGTAPFEGNYLEVLADKQRVDPRPPSAVVEGIPPRLDSLCRDLLSRQESRRPSGEEILDRLSVSRQTSGISQHRPSSARRLVGREPARKTIVDAFEQTVEGVPTVVAVAGTSGIGKSALVQAVLTDIRQHFPKTLILSGRCYQRESVPYKALDSIVDGLARYLRRLPAIEAQALLPRDVGSMAQIFPIMAGLAGRLAIPADAHEVRRRAWAGLRETLARVGDRQPIVVFVDDLQWGDSDSAALLADVLRPPDAPLLLFIGAHRDVEIATSAFLRPFYADVMTASQSRTLHLQPLSAGEAEELAAQLLPSPLATEQMVRLIAAESGGSPFFVDELVRFAEISGRVAGEPARPADSHEREATLAHMVATRQARLSDSPSGCFSWWP